MKVGLRSLKAKLDILKIQYYLYIKRNQVKFMMMVVDLLTYLNAVETKPMQKVIEIHWF